VVNLTHFTLFYLLTLLTATKFVELNLPEPKSDCRNVSTLSRCCCCCRDDAIG